MDLIECMLALPPLWQFGLMVRCDVDKDRRREAA
jgi:hypothetical protein